VASAIGAIQAPTAQAPNASYFFRRKLKKWSSVLFKALLLSLAFASCVLAKGCEAPGVNHPVGRTVDQTSAAPPTSPAPMPKLLAVYMPWFGDQTHLNVGYSSNNASVLRKQIQQARTTGIAAFVIDWYGDNAPYSDHNFALLQKVASKSHFQVALLYNEPEDEDAEATDGAIAAFDKAYKSYIGPSAKYRDAYLTYQGRPLIFIFPKQGHVDWNRVREHVSDWAAAPLLIYKDEPPAGIANDFAGSFAWVQPGAGGWATDGSNWGEQYLENFYKTMKNKYPDKIAIGGAWPGFDDSAAKWGLNRHMQNGCGKTFDATLHFYKRFYDSSNPLPFLLIETWNDYEEGTAIERGTSADCGGDQKGMRHLSAQH
jgi:hypothetical protein